MGSNEDPLFAAKLLGVARYELEAGYGCLRPTRQLGWYWKYHTVSVSVLLLVLRLCNRKPVGMGSLLACCCVEYTVFGGYVSVCLSVCLLHVACW